MTSARILELTEKTAWPWASAGLVLMVFAAAGMTQPPLFARMR